MVEEHPAHCTAHSSWAGMPRGSSNTKNWRKVKVPASEMLWNKVSHRAGGIGIGQLNPEIRSEVWASLECRWNRGFCASSHISGLCLCGLAHTACSFLTHTSMARYMLFAPPRSAPEWAALQMHFTSFELPMRSGGAFKQSWQSFRIYLDNNMYNKFCFLSQKLFVQIWLCVSVQAQTIAAIHAGLGVVYILPDLFICGVVPTLEMPVYWGLCLILYLFTYPHTYSLLS